MKASRKSFVILLPVALLIACSIFGIDAMTRFAVAPPVITSQDIGGVVTSSAGPEAGIWVIAETTSLPTKLANFVDQSDTLGLGKNVPISPGTNSDSIIALLPDSKRFVVIRVPYPLGFYSRGMDGRIDDTNGGWQGQGLWSTYASTGPWHVEGGKGMTSKVVKFQVRPDPLAK